MFKSAKIAAIAGSILGMALVGSVALAAGSGGSPSVVTKCTIDDWECTLWTVSESPTYCFERECSLKAGVSCTDVDNIKPPETSLPGGWCDDKPEDEVLPVCQAEDWDCDSWECVWYVDHDIFHAVRTCNHSENCLYTENTKPEENNLSCKEVIPKESQPESMVCTEDDWTCTAWSDECEWLDGTIWEASRFCSRTRDCIDYDNTNPATKQLVNQSCQAKPDKYSSQYGHAWSNTVRLMNSSPSINTSSFTPPPSIDDDKGLFSSGAGTCTPNTLIKTASMPAVYYCGSDGKRYVFPNEKTYFSWFDGFDFVTTISEQTMASIMIGGNVTYRPGMRMVKITSDPTVYAVGKGGVLRPIASEAVALELYGNDWNTKIDDISDAFFVNYTVGSVLDF